MNAHHKFEFQASEHYDKLRADKANKRGTVIRFLRDNPLSTTQEVWNATGISVNQVVGKGIFKRVKYEGKMVWRLCANPNARI